SENETSWSDEAQEMFDTVKEQWGKLSPTTKGLAIAGGAIGALWLLNKMFNSGSGSGKLTKLLGIGALIAGGVYIAGKYMSLDKAYETLSSGFEKLKQADFVKGLKAFVSGDMETAKRHWGEAYETIRQRINGREEREQPTSRVDENGIEWVEAPEALRTYFEDIKREVTPVTSFIREHYETLAAGGFIFGVTHLNALRAGLTMSKDSLLSLIKIMGSGIT